jgi:multidrug efflux pump subunit AcrA (membrane-fusion protein)
VRLEDVRRVVPGQQVLIETAAVDGPLKGKVLFATSAADIQKNTLTVKVAIDEPPPVLKPEMLVQVTFLAPEGVSPPRSEGERMRVFVPRELVERQNGDAAIWIADQTAGVARRQTVRAGRTTGGPLVEIAEGLTPASRLIVAGREGLRDGQRIRVIGEDTTLGLQTASK